MLDKYILGEFSGVSPEVPIQIVKVEKESYAPEGTAYVANNVATLNIARNLNFNVKNITTANLDFIDHYRPRVNIVKRPTLHSGEVLILLKSTRLQYQIYTKK